MLERINEFFGIFVGYLAPVLFMEVNGFPLIVLILLFGALIFTFYFRFINVRGFRHSIDIIKGKYDNPKDIGQSTKKDVRGPHKTTNWDNDGIQTERSNQGWKEFRIKKERKKGRKKQNTF